MKHSTEDFMIETGEREALGSLENIGAEIAALEACVDDFADKMKKKLREKYMEGKTGWDDPDWSHEDRIAALEEHLEKGDMIDVANFAMFVWNNE